MKKIETARFPYFWQLIFFETIILIFIVSTRPDLLTAGIPGPYYFTSFQSIDDLFILSLYANTTIIFIFMFLGLRFINISKYNSGYFLSSFFVTNLFILMISILIGFQPNRMGIHLYFVPIFYSAGLYFLICHLAPHFAENKRLPSKAIISLFLVAIFFTNNLTLVYDSTISSPNKTEIMEYDNRIRESDVQSSIYISSNLISHLDTLVEPGEQVITLPQSQGVIAAYIDINTIHQEILVETFFRDDIPHLFNTLNITYLVLSQNDIKPLSERSMNTLSSTFLPIEYFDNKPFLNLIYSNSLGERIYEYKNLDT